MVDQVKLNDAGMICHLMKVSSWSHDAALFPVSFYPTKSVDRLSNKHLGGATLPFTILYIAVFYFKHGYCN